MTDWTMSAVRRRPPRWVWASAGTVLLVVALAALLALAAHQPPWFAPTAIDYARLPADKRRFVDLLDGIGDDLYAGRAADLRLSADQLNRWLAARSELPSAYQLELGPVRFPQTLLLGDGRIRVAGVVSRWGFDLVGWADLRLSLADELLAVEFERARLGALPLPRTWLAAALPDSVANAETRGIPRGGRWPNGERPFRLEAFAIEPNELRVTLTPLIDGATKP